MALTPLLVGTVALSAFIEILIEESPDSGGIPFINR